ncbi:hypothetical protein AG1IA_10103 [Rhizoctonia solani AG-1 IA]|uniref:Uncharacterized protein n=1 Tax=Thanatephorus cucumeris (strain AG1-IA) TaxID=983506 RepID=L8WGM5_THACA|nr:hypothetical protein AG1IA_10103 [Rhizoctonia solani AG-1 IA]
MAARHPACSTKIAIARERSGARMVPCMLAEPHKGLVTCGLSYFRILK